MRVTSFALASFHTRNIYTLSILLPYSRVSLEYTWSMLRVWLEMPFPYHLSRMTGNICSCTVSTMCTRSSAPFSLLNPPKLFRREPLSFIFSLPRVRFLFPHYLILQEAYPRHQALRILLTAP